MTDEKKPELSEMILSMTHSIIDDSVCRHQVNAILKEDDTILQEVAIVMDSFTSGMVAGLLAAGELVFREKYGEEEGSKIFKKEFTFEPDSPSHTALDHAKTFGRRIFYEIQNRRASPEEQIEHYLAEMRGELKMMTEPLPENN